METQVILNAGPSVGEGDVLPLNAVDAIVDRLRGMRRTATLALAIDVGNLVVEGVFRGDIAAVRLVGRKHRGFRQLASHPRIPFAKSTLWRYVRVYDLVRRMPGLVRHDGITVAHLTAVLSLDSTGQERLLEIAAKNGWTAARLAKEAESATGKTRGSRKRPGLMVSVQRLERIHATVPDLGRVSDLDQAERARVRSVLEGTRAWCEAVDRWLQAATTEN